MRPAPRRLQPNLQGRGLIAGRRADPPPWPPGSTAKKRGHPRLLSGSRGYHPDTRARRLAVLAPRDPAQLRRFRRRPGRIIFVASQGGFDQIVMAAEEPAPGLRLAEPIPPDQPASHNSPPLTASRSCLCPDRSNPGQSVCKAARGGPLCADHLLCAAMTAKGPRTRAQVCRPTTANASMRQSAPPS